MPNEPTEPAGAPPEPGTEPGGAAPEPQADPAGAPPESQADPAPPRRGLFAGLTRNVFVLGLTSLFTDISSEMIVPVRILFLVGVLGTPLPLAGLIEGVAESTASILKIFSGRLADRVADRKPLILAGYTLSNAAKPLIALVTSWQAAFGFIFLDRVGKGFRGSPRDALLADSAEPQYRGKAFGFHRAMDTLGAAIGPLWAFAILASNGQDLRGIFAWTAIPGVLSVLVLILFLREKRREVPAPKAAAAGTPAARPGSPRPLSPAWWQQLGSLGPRFWLFTAVSTVFALGNSSDAFIFLRTEGLEKTLEAVPLVYFGYNLVYAALATPLGALSDRVGRMPLLIAGYLTFGLVYAGWAFASTGWHVIVLFLIYGIYAAATEGVGKALITDVIHKSQRGTAMGWFNGLTGFVALPANVLGGWLWATFGPAATFGFGAWAGFTAAALMLAWMPWLLGKRQLQEPVAAPATPTQTPESL